jgi:hypothetical protein
VGRRRLLHHTKAEIGHLPVLRDAGSLQLDPSGAAAGEEPHTVAEQDGREVDQDLVYEPFVDASGCRRRGR